MVKLLSLIYTQKETDYMALHLKVIRKTLKNIYSYWGILFPIMIFLVISKFALFYSMMGVTSEFIPMLLISIWLTGAMFYGVKRKQIPAGIYFLLSFLIFFVVGL